MKQHKPRLPTNLDSIIGKRIRLGRQLRSMSQEDLAEQLGISFQQLQKYENATNRVAASRLYEIAKIMKLPLSYFFGDKEIIHKEIDLVIDEDSIAILREFQPLSKKNRRVIRDLLAQLASAA